MAYRKIDSRIWNDAKFRDLSDNGKLVFFMLLTHPNMTSLGAMRATMSGLAEEIGWATEAFREAFREASSKAMVEWDERALCVALPNFIKYNPPESPNVVKAWDKSLDLLPECTLKTHVVLRAQGFLEGKSKAFVEALPEGFREAFAKAMPNQEQEQEQEQEQNKPVRSESANAKSDPPPGKPKPSKFKFDPPDHELAVRMSNPVKDRFPDQQINLDQWADAVRKLRVIDKRSRGDIIALWSWIVNHDRSGFSWADNCRTPMKLREKKDGLSYFEIIRSQMLRSEQLPAREPSTRDLSLVDSLTDRSWAATTDHQTTG